DDSDVRLGLSERNFTVHPLLNSVAVRKHFAHLRCPEPVAKNLAVCHLGLARNSRKARYFDAKSRVSSPATPTHLLSAEFVPFCVAEYRVRVENHDEKTRLRISTRRTQQLGAFCCCACIELRWLGDLPPQRG